MARRPSTKPPPSSEMLSVTIAVADGSEDTTVERTT